MASAEMTVRTPLAARLASAAARPEVKLRFTGILPAQTTARLAMKAPAPGGSTIPTRSSATPARMRRASTAATTTSCAALTGRRPAVPSTTTQRPGFLASARITSRPRWRRSDGRSSKASAPRSSSARRAATTAAPSGGRAAPKATKTGVGIRRGDFQRYLCPANENTEPQSPSIAAGITGTPARCARISKPRLISISWPVREICPSGKRQTSSPAWRARMARCMAAEGCRTERGITPASRNPSLSHPAISGPT